MKRLLFSQKVLLGVAFALFSAFILDNASPNWGFFAHRKINELAVYTLPPEMMYFYKPQIDYISEHAIDADKRRYASEFEAIRHYINADLIDTYPFNKLPRKWTEALAKFSDVYLITRAGDTLQILGEEVTTYSKWDLTLHGSDLPQILGVDTLVIKKWAYLNFFRKNVEPQYYQPEWTLPPDALDSLWFNQDGMFPTLVEIEKIIVIDKLSKLGILPWHLEKMFKNLTNAFQERDTLKIFRLSADIGHYVADAHVPLHTTQNYDGQLTGQKGIHSFWESRLPELFMEEEGYDFFVGKAEYIDDPTTFFWDVILQSFILADSVLTIEKELRKAFSEEEIYCYDNVGDRTFKTFCKEYAKVYHQRLNGMVERQMRKSIKALGDVWFTAWVNAGQPNLLELRPEQPPVKQEWDLLQEQEDKFKKGKIKGRSHDGKK